jgi:hypothetical protein
MAESEDNGQLSAGDLAKAALRTVYELTGFTPQAATGLEWDGDMWNVTVDVLELERIPNTTDVIGTYEVRLDSEGTLRGYRRVRRYVRGDAREEG